MPPTFPFFPTLIVLLSLTLQLTTAYDPCGPLIPVENITVSTCTAPLTQVPLPAIYGVQCFGNFNPPFLPPNGTDCKDLIPQICAVMSDRTLIYEIWHWISNPTNTCTMGFYMPGPKDHGDGTVFSAPVPTKERCQGTIFDSMLNACTGRDKWNTAAVNLAQYPGNGVNGEPAAGGEGYPSYFISGTKPQTPVKPQ